MAAASSSAPGPCSPVDLPIDGVPIVANPFDPAVIDVVVAFAGPGGTAADVPAFFSQDHTRTLSPAGVETVTPVGAPGWRVRFTPTAAGAWAWVPRVRLGSSAPVDLPEQAFTCAPDPGEHGVLQRSTADPHHLAWADGTPYVAIGENLAWYGPGGTFDYDRWIGGIAAHGATWIRVWMPSWSMGLEWLRRDGSGAIVESSLGNYTTRLDRAWQLDHVIDLARRNGIVVQLVVNNPEWVDSPYNVANGGPLTEPAGMFTDPTARDLFRRRLRYIVARWGHASNVVWELWNETDVPLPPDPNAVIDWHLEMARYLAQIDAGRHLRTTSTFFYSDFLTPTPVFDRLWASPDIDIVQVHAYGVGLDAPVDFTSLLPQVVQVARARYGKPVLVGEAGVDFRGPTETLAADPDGQGLHELVWAGLFAGSVGTGMTWWWDSLIEPHDQYRVLDPIASLTRGIELDQERFQPGAVAATGSEPHRVLSLIGATTALVWVRAEPVTPPDPAPATGTLTGLPAGTWRLAWFDPHTGQETDGGTVVVTGATAAVALPTFDGELALRATMIGPAPDLAPTQPAPAVPVLVVPAFTG